MTAMNEQSALSLSADEVHVLRHTLGLNRFQRQPSRNHTGGLDLVKHFPTIDSLIERGLMEPRSLIGPGGREWFYVATDAGIETTMEHPWPTA